MDTSEPVKMDTGEAVRLGAEIFADAEAKAAKIRKAFRQLRDMFETIRDEGHIGGLECGAMACECDALATRFEADVWALHSKLTKRAQELGIDLPLRDGGR